MKILNITTDAAAGLESDITAKATLRVVDAELLTKYFDRNDLLLCVDNRLLPWDHPYFDTSVADGQEHYAGIIEATDHEIELLRSKTNYTVKDMRNMTLCSFFE